MQRVLNWIDGLEADGKTRDKGGRAAAFQPGPGGRGQGGGRGGRGGDFQPGPGGRGGPRGDFGPGPGFQGGPFVAQRALDELNLSGAKLEKAESAYRESIGHDSRLPLSRFDLGLVSSNFEERVRCIQEAADLVPFWRGVRIKLLSNLVDELKTIGENIDGNERKIDAKRTELNESQRDLASYPDVSDRWVWNPINHLKKLLLYDWGFSVSLTCSKVATRFR